MGNLELIKCTNCGGSLEGARKESDILYICPYCEGKNYVNPSYSFYKNLIEKSFGDLESSVRMSLEIGKLEQEITKALESGNIKKALEGKGQLILIYQQMNPVIKSDEDKESFFEIEMHRFKRERLDENGKKLKEIYDKAVAGGNLRSSVAAFLELEFYKTQGCHADEKMVKATRNGILESTKYFIKGFYKGTSAEKKRIIQEFGLDEGLLKVGEKFRCPMCGGEVTVEQVKEISQCPYCGNLFQKSGVEELARAMGFDSESGEKGEIQEMMEQTQLTPEQVKMMQDAAKDYIDIPEVKIPCPFCGKEIIIENSGKITCPHCGKSLE